MKKQILLLLFLVAAASCVSAAPKAKIPSEGEMAEMRREVETLRGKKFLRDVPARTINEKELRAIVDREIAKQYPGRKLSDLQDLMAALDLIPPKTDLRAVCGDLLVDQVAGLYDTDTKAMCLPAYEHTNHTAAPKSGKNRSEKKLEELPGPAEPIIFVHEFTHAIEDQYWPIDSPADRETGTSTDRGDAHMFLVEGSATRLMIEALPAQIEGDHPGAYMLFWNFLHSGMGEMTLNYILGEVWKSPDVKVAGVPEALARGEAMPYSFGYAFCTKILRRWGLDGLDYIYNHPPVSSEQVMHPEKCWGWRDFPVEIGAPETLPGGWHRRADESVGEAGVAVLLGCQLKNLNRGLRVAEGWDGDRAMLYDAPDGRQLLVWASSWDSPNEASRFASAYAEERRVSRNATVTKRAGQNISWTCPDGRTGTIWLNGKRVIVFETDKAEALRETGTWAKAVTFAEPPQDAARQAINHAYLRFNPLVSYRKDGDYTVTRSLAGLLWRHDQNSIGAADRAVLGALGEWRRTASFDQWKLGWGLVAKHQSETRRGLTKTTLLPWGLLWSHFYAAVPQSPTNHISRDSVLWGLAGSRTVSKSGRHSVRVLPAGLLFRSTTGPGQTAVHVLGTGVAVREKEGEKETAARVLGFRVWKSVRKE